jgi:hypothetical protein
MSLISIITTALQAVGAEVKSKAPKASPTFTGVPAAPTAAAATNTTQIATCAHVFAERTNTRTLTNTRVSPRAVTVASAATHTIDADAVDYFTVTAQSAAVTFAAPVGTPTAGQRLMIRLRDNGAARAITWNAVFVSSGVASLPTTTVINKSHHIGLIWDEVASKWMCLSADVNGY